MTNKYEPILVGQADSRKVFVDYGEYLKILKFAKAGASDGCRGVLLGRKDGDCVYILKALEAVYSGSEEIELPVFSPQSWGRITAEINENFSELEIVGQFSSHLTMSPNRTDYIMQDRFFDKNSNLLYLFDPSDNSERFYIYDNREFYFLSGFYLFDKFENPINLTLREAVVRPLSREYELRVRIFEDIKKKLKRQNNIYAIISVFIIFMIIFDIIHSFELEKRMEELSLRNGEKIQWRLESDS